MTDTTMTPGTDRKCVLILDVNSGGHHPTYVRWLIEAFAPETTRIVLGARPEMFDHPEIVASEPRFEPHPIVVDAGFAARLSDFGALALARMSWSIGRLYRRVFREVHHDGRVDFVIVPFLDDCLLGLAPGEAFDSVPWLAITMRTMFHYPQMGIEAPPQRFTALRRYLLGRVLRQRSLGAILTIDPTLAEFGRSHGPEFRDKLRHLPDPCTYHQSLPTRSEARALLGIPEHVPLIVLYGEISARKGVIALLQAAADPRCETSLHVMLAGRCRDVQSLMGSTAFQSLRAAGRLHSIDRYVSRVEEGLLLAAGDWFWLGYTGFYGMSGILVLAGRHGVPVLASREGLIGYLTKEHSLGARVNPRDKTAVIDALNSMMSDAAGLKQAGRNGAKLFARHDPQEFRRIVTEQTCRAWTQD